MTSTQLLGAQTVGTDQTHLSLCYKLSPVLGPSPTSDQASNKDWTSRFVFCLFVLAPSYRPPPLSCLWFRFCTFSSCLSPLIETRIAPICSSIHRVSDFQLKLYQHINTKGINPIKTFWEAHCMEHVRKRPNTVATAFHFSYFFLLFYFNFHLSGVLSMCQLLEGWPWGGELDVQSSLRRRAALIGADRVA